MNTRFQWQWLPPILIYAASTLEVFIMISPFAAFFYSVYTPLFHGLTQFEATAWLPQFFLPHFAQTRNLLFQALSYLGPVLAVTGLVGFIVCAIQLYYGKFVLKRLVDSGLYGRVRHPQYLCLALAGLGFLLVWPRFLILLTYLMMLGLYYILARHEEKVIREKYGRDSERYLARIPMFNPLRASAGARGWRSPSRSTALAVWLGLVAAGLGLAFLLRAEAKTQLYAVQWSSPDVTAISFTPRTDERIITIMQTTLASPALRVVLQEYPDDALLMQIVTGGPETKHLLTDLGMKAGAVRAFQLPDQGEYVVVSRLTGLRERVDPFALDTRIEPLFFVRPRDLIGDLEVRAFVPEQFYPNFLRVLF